MLIYRMSSCPNLAFKYGVFSVKYYTAVGRTPDESSMNYTDVLSKFQIDHEHYEKLKKQDAPKVPAVKGSDTEKKVIKWDPVFEDCMSLTIGLQGPTAYVLKKYAAVPPEKDDPLVGHNYFGKSGGLIEELTARLPQTET